MQQQQLFTEMKSFPSAVTLKYCNLKNSASDWSEPLAMRFCTTERNFPTVGEILKKGNMAYKNHENY